MAESLGPPISRKDYEGSNWPVRDERVCCNLVRVRKVGNFYILAEWRRRDGKKRRMLLGPYWHFLLVTLVVIAAVSVMIYAFVVPAEDEIERVIGLTVTMLAVSGLLCTALTDPGIFPRYSKPLVENWTYSEYAQSYRPPGVIFCQQSQVLIEDYNHFCPWSGTVIGKGNEAYFQVFIVAIVVAFLYDLLVIALSLENIGF
ncbi:hypothetical protein CTAYLR_010772 [Chrysophaeum taylorii]|uniref:Palmitoyltransferase n=1 Tax=Chrysophaeum taylorii TaxID=2483200 RepID=A0AAD7XMT0_9STRA|nr:hypothetical protein CTAYLR_010772 [Chrysophaeum taylorii]